MLWAATRQPLHIISLAMLMAAIKRMGKVWIGGRGSARQVMSEIRDNVAGARTHIRPNCDASGNVKVDVKGDKEGRLRFQALSLMRDARSIRQQAIKWFRQGLVLCAPSAVNRTSRQLGMDGRSGEVALSSRKVGTTPVYIDKKD